MSSPAPVRPRRRFEAGSWGGALVLIVAVTAVIWVVQIVNAQDDYRLDRFGLRPRAVSGLWGVLTVPFLHSSWGQLLANTLPLVLIGWVVMIEGVALWSVVSAGVVVVGGLLTWVVAPGGTVVVGAGALVFGWLGYLITRALVSRRVRRIVTAAMVLIVFGALLNNLVPAAHSHGSWQARLCEFLAGAAAGAALHAHGGEGRRRVRGAVS